MGFFSKEKIDETFQKKEEYKKYTILLVDDEEANLRSLSGLLENDYNILTASDGNKGLHLINNHPNPESIHLIISDQRMPEKTGVEFLKETICTIPETVRIILTGFTDIGAIISAINDGKVYKFLTKPIEPEDFKITVRRALETFELEQNNKKLVNDLKDLNNSLEKKVDERTIELKEINELQKGLVSVIIHDLKNPLGNILMFSKHLIAKGDLIERNKYTVQLINDSGSQMLKLVENLLEIDKLEQGGIELRFEETDLVHILNRAVEEFSEQANKKGIKLEFKSDIEQAVAYLDNMAIKRVMSNIISNAIP